MKEMRCVEKHFFSSKIRFSCNENIGETFFALSECLSNVLITGESNFDERNGQEMFN